MIVAAEAEARDRQATWMRFSDRGKDGTYVRSYSRRRPRR
jgi:hypothetical protein